MKKIFILIIIFSALFIHQRLFAKTRNEIINLANQYKNYGPWKPTENNILDDQTHDEGSTAEPTSGKDKIDDRMWAKDENGEWHKSTDNWPFEVGVEVRGEAYAEAYAWGYGHHLHPGVAPAGATWKSFKEYLQTGRKVGAYKSTTKDLGVTDDYGTDNRFTGSDCSGFITRVWGIKRFTFRNRRITSELYFNK